MADEKQSTNHNARVGGREETWSRLEGLLEKVKARGLRSLTNDEIEAIGKLYRATAAHLALLKTFGASVKQRDRLNALVSRAYGTIYGRTRVGKNRRVWIWSFLAFPQIIRRTLRYHALAAFLLVLGGLYGYFGAAADPDWVLEFVAPGDDRTPYASTEELREFLHHGRPSSASESDSEQRDMGSGEKTLFTAFLWQHNTKVALLSFFAGFLIGLPTVVLLFFNGAMLGVYSYTYHSHGLALEWWAWILPHGVTELLAIVLLSGGGLFVGHLILSPGRLTRRDVLRERRGEIVTIIVYAFPMLLLAAVIESFVRQSGFSEPGRYVFAGVSAVLWVAYLGVGRVPARLIQAEQARRTLAERAVPLPVEEELLSALTGRAAR